MPVTNHCTHNPVLEAMAVYNREPCLRTFQEDLELHLLTGHVHSTPTYFIMGRPVHSEAPYDEITDPAIKFDNPDCWHIYLASGDITAFWRHEVIRFPFVSWERNNVLRVHPMDRVKEFYL